ncbi:predicted protein [Nematostella vectensis]|uniref:Sulfatase-modifying factor enzyme-like domain-containing protein n=1 Tax=Nematostella vectensis TaxID=45351 RepID=A7SDH3_NEMVE|nr:predicted protein [Nematostella vectensis]|eukprot:XP_001630288.1 predicted protein [Nematostella vectensis]
MRPPKPKEISFSSCSPCDLSALTKSDVKKYFVNSYDLYENLFLSLKDPSAFYKYPDALRLPLIFYYGHTAAVYVNKLMLAQLIKKRVNVEFEAIFETGVDEMSWDDTENFRMGGEFTWPKVSAVAEYRRRVREVILEIIETTPMELPITQGSPWWALFMGMEHERIHLETSSVLIRQLPLSYVQRPPNWMYAPTKSGIVPEFEATKYMITNGEFLEFVRTGGYENKSLWSKEGWEWRSFRQARHPTFWVCDQACRSGCGADLQGYSHCSQASDVNSNEKPLIIQNGTHYGSASSFSYRAMYDVLELPLDWPAEVNYHEAKAYCAWRGPQYRLPTEAEHHAMRGPQKPVSIGVKSDTIFQDKIEANINMKFGSSSAVNLFPANKAGFHDVFGNAWSWAEDHFNGLPGNDTHYLYDDFSSPTFDGKHYMIMGGSWVSTGDEASRFARFSFRPHFFQHLGFRLVRSATAEQPPVRLVSTEVFVMGAGVQERSINVPGLSSTNQDNWFPSTNSQYSADTIELLSSELVKHYGSTEVSPFINYCIEATKKQKTPRGTALHLLCSVGRDSFELSKHFDKVCAVDHSGRLVDAALRLQKGEGVDCTTQNGTDHVQLATSTDPDRVVFKQLTWLPIEIGTFDMIAFTALERLSNPKAWLVRMREIVNPAGLLIVDAHHDWDQDALAALLGKRFRMLGCKPGIHFQREGTRDSDRCHGAVTIWRKDE